MFKIVSITAVRQRCVVMRISSKLSLLLNLEVRGGSDGSLRSHTLVAGS